MTIGASASRLTETAVISDSIPVLPEVWKTIPGRGLKTSSVPLKPWPFQRQQRKEVAMH